MGKREQRLSRATQADRDALSFDFGTRSAGDEAAFGSASVLARHGAASAAGPADFSAVLSLSDLDGSNGFRLEGIDAGDYSGIRVSCAGDVNGDGVDDVLVGASRAGPGGDALAGESYVVFGKASEFAASVDLATLDGSNGFRMDGIDALDQSGFALSSAGDFNGDGFDDVIIGAVGGDAGGDRDSGESYVVFGKAGGFAASLDLATLDGSNGFRLDGIDAQDLSGHAVSSAGDVNGDGFDDVIIGADGASPDGVAVAGESYVVFGRAGGFAASIDLATLDGTNGFRIDGGDIVDRSGCSVSSAGDVNGDGFDDVIIGAVGGDVGGNRDAGESYVVFGKAGGFAASLDLLALDGTNGFRIDGIDADDYSGQSVSSAGDVNGDGFDDIIIGAYGADPGGHRYAGESYVVFGSGAGFAASVDLASLDGTNGFRITGIDRHDLAGYVVSSAGDVNADGFDDVIIGAKYAGDGGESYVVFGKAGGHGGKLDLATLDGGNGFRIEGDTVGDTSRISASAAGDVNGDGFDDIIIGAAGVYGTRDPGESYVIFGVAPSEGVIRIGSEADQTIRGGDFDDLLRGRQGDDLLIGGGGNNWLRGGRGKDELVGGLGIDRMDGGDGHDIVTGGAGADVFVLASATARDADELLDFAPGEDRIALGSDAFGLTGGALDPDSFVTGGAAGDADDRLIYDAATGRLFFDADGSGVRAQVLIATLSGAPALTAGDIEVVAAAGGTSPPETPLARAFDTGDDLGLAGPRHFAFAPAGLLMPELHAALA